MARVIAPVSLMLGLLFGAGCWSAWVAVARRGGPSLLDRVEPHVLDVSDEARRRREERRLDPLPVLGSFVSALLYRVAAVVPWRSEGVRTTTLLRQSGSGLSLLRFRVELIAWATLGAAIATALATTATIRGEGNAVLVLAPVVGVGAGACARVLFLRRSAAVRRRRIESELQCVVELTVLSLAAGANVAAALARASATSRGPLGRELAVALALGESGESLPRVLQDLALELRIADVHRFLDQLVASFEHGAPVVEVLMSQLGDLRAARRRRVIENGGQREIAMLLPLVFVILPVTVLFAVFPGFSLLGQVVR